jgi:putative salt-induced outer membrane protein
MKAFLIASAAVVSTPLLAAPALAQTPEGLLDQSAASTGRTDIATDGFEAGVKPPDESKNGTEMNLSAGGFFSTGNTRTESITSSTQFRMRRNANQASAAGAANFGRAAIGDQELDTTVENFQGRGRYDRFLTGRLAAFLGSTGRRDRFQGLNLRLNIDPGLAYYFLDDPSHQFWGEFGYDVQIDLRTAEAITAGLAEGEVVANSETRHSTRAFTGYENKLNTAVTFTTGVEYIQSFQETKNWRLNWDWGLTSTIVGRLAAATTFSLRYDNNPLANVQKTDIVTAVSLVMTLL